jgi:hypothetical protein
MKHFYHLITLLLFVLALLFWVNAETRYRDFSQKVEAELMAKDLRIQQLEKEIRIIRTDLDIMENGFEK